MNRLSISILCLGLGWSVAGLAAPTPAPADVTQLKQQRAEALAENQSITELQAAEAAGDWPKAEALAQKLVGMDPARWEYRQALGDSQLKQGKYAEALQAYAAALEGAGKAKPDAHTRQAMSTMFNNQGAAYIKLKRNDEAVQAFTQAATLSDQPATAWFNVCATEYNLGAVDPALAACEKAIAADPRKADAWFIKGSLLVGNAGVDANGKIAPPPGTVEALRKYLELAPAGPHADDVKQMLDALGIAP